MLHRREDAAIKSMRQHGRDAVNLIWRDIFQCDDVYRFLIGFAARQEFRGAGGRDNARRQQHTSNIFLTRVS